MIGILVLTHGGFGEEILKTACGIMHESEKVAALNLSRRLDFPTLRKRVSETILSLNVAGVLVLIDAYGGTSYNTTLPLMNTHPISHRHRRQFADGAIGADQPAAHGARGVGQKSVGRRQENNFGIGRAECGRAREEFDVIEKTYTINNRLGLHARPASLFVKTTSKFQSQVKIVKDGQEIDGKSIMGLADARRRPGHHSQSDRRRPRRKPGLKSLGRLVRSPFRRRRRRRNNYGRPKRTLFAGRRGVRWHRHRPGVRPGR